MGATAADVFTTVDAETGSTFIVVTRLSGPWILSSSSRRQRRARQPIWRTHDDRHPAG